jgi:beta-glucanase (GH16 family)
MRQKGRAYLLVLLCFCICSTFMHGTRIKKDPLNGNAHPSGEKAHSPKVVFFDDFSGNKLDRSKWNAEITGMHVNNELQAYVDSSATIYLENNALVLRPVFSSGFTTKDGQKFDFISGRINTKSKFDFKYGTAEARIKVTDGAGLWPAWWMLGNGVWPETGELDIMEYVGEKDWASAAVHGPGYSGETPFVNRLYFSKNNDVTQWHIYALDWTPDSLIFKYDGVPIFRVTKTMAAFYGKWAFDNNKYLILNFALGGIYPAKINGIQRPYYGLASSTLEQIKNNKTKMWIDWVRVTQQ